MGAKTVATHTPSRGKNRSYCQQWERERERSLGERERVLPFKKLSVEQVAPPHLLFVSSGVLREDRRGREPPNSTVEHQSLLGLDWSRQLVTTPQHIVDHWHLPHTHTQQESTKVLLVEYEKCLIPMKVWMEHSSAHSYIPLKYIVHCIDAIIITNNWANVLCFTRKNVGWHANFNCVSLPYSHVVVIQISPVALRPDPVLLYMPRCVHTARVNHHHPQFIQMQHHRLHRALTHLLALSKHPSCVQSHTSQAMGWGRSTQQV